MFSDRHCVCHIVTNSVNIPDKDSETSLLTLTLSCSDPSDSAASMFDELSVVAYAGMISSPDTMRSRMSVCKTEVRNPIRASVPNKALFGVWN